MQNIVHLDLKGAPLKLPFFEKVILCIKDWGAAGIVLEWEDTFPYWGELSELGSLGVGSGDNMYTLQEVKHILHFIKQNGMEPIQLIQTIGHLEFVLKHPSYQELREQPSSPAVLCPSKQASLDLVRLMVMQVLDVQPVAEYFHIGADEVWHTGVCADCQQRAAASPHGTASLYLAHVSSLSRFLKQRRPSLNIMMWDDMLRTVSAEAMIHYQLGELVEPVVWDYSMQEHFRIDPEIWGNYKQVFPKIWAGSAYKGANGSAQMVSPVERYVSNQVAWLNEARSLREEGALNICGVLLTGWSRYTHYATLCELLPVSLPSLYSCLQTLRLTCRRGRIAVNEAVIAESLPDREWPGRDVAVTIHTVANLTKQSRDFMDNEVKTWLNPWQIEKGFTNPLQLESIARNARLFTAAITQLQLPSLLRSVTGARSADEWVATNVTPTLTQLDRVYADACFRATKGASVMPAIENTRQDKYEG